MSKQTIKEYGTACLIAIIALIITLGFVNLGKTSITGFAVLDENATINASTNETTTTTTTETLTETPAVDKEKKEKAEKEEKPEKEEKQEKPIEKPEIEERPKQNVPPVWKSDVEEFVLKGKTSIDLSEYFYDANNDSLAYLFTTPERITVDIDASVVTLTPKGHNFTTIITFTATDGEKATTKEIKLIVPEKTITINLQYKQGTSYDIDNDGYEPTQGVIDLTVENSLFSWDVDPTKLCTRWKVKPADEEESTTVCYGSEKCCNFVGIAPSRDKWDGVFYSTYGQYGAGLNSTVSAQIIYVDYELNIDEPFAEIYYSNWQDLMSKFYFASIDFENVCVDTCILSGFNLSSYNLIFEIENAVLNLNLLAYSIVEEISKVFVDLAVKDNNGTNSGSYQLYKDNVPVQIIDEFVEPDYYNIEVTPKESIIDKLIIENVNITKPLTATIGIDNVTREIVIGNADIKKSYAINLEELEFEKATLTATASANSLYKCSQWSYDSEFCFGTWEKIKDLVVGQQYELTLTKETLGFIEAELNITPAIELNLTNITKLFLYANISNITIGINSNASINLSQFFLNIDNTTTFNYYKPDNISIAFDVDIATIIPDKDFIGIEYSYIIANKTDNLVVSNLFSINVVEIPKIFVPLNLTEVLVNITDPLIKLKLKEHADKNLKPVFNYASIDFTAYQIKNEVVIVYITVDDKDITWLTSLTNFNELMS